MARKEGSSFRGGIKLTTNRLAFLDSYYTEKVLSIVSFKFIWVLRTHEWTARDMLQTVGGAVLV